MESHFTGLDASWVSEDLSAVWGYGSDLPPEYTDQVSIQTPSSYDPPGENPTLHDYDAPEVAIAIMGATGSGKSTFINLVSRSDFCIGAGLRSCTSEIQVADAFHLDGRRVIMIDTPGFDDTTLSDTDILKMIAAFLETSYESGYKLAGILYFHRISDVRMGGVSAKNIRMFRKLCGDNTLGNIIIVTNMWGEVSPQVGDAREAELIRDGLFFKPLLRRGAQIIRHTDTVSSAEAIVRRVLNNHPLPLRIQEELVDEEKEIPRTEAGEELSRDFNVRLKKYQDEVRALKQEIQQVKKEKDNELKKELEAEREKMKKEITRVEMEVKQLGPSYKKEKERLRAQLAQAQKRYRGGFRFNWSFFGLFRRGGNSR